MSALHANSLVFQVPSENGEQKTLIDNISLEFPEGSFTCVIGPSGCGKSTLLNLLAGITHPTSGDVKLAGYDVSRLKEELPLTVGFLPQFASFHEELSVLEVLEYALKLRLSRAVSSEHKQQWLDKTIDLTGIRNVIHQSPATLSGGQLRRLALAEQLLGDPPFLFLDELTSGLDPHSEREIMWWLSDLAKKTNKTIVLVTHSLANLEASDHVVFLNKGRLIYSGKPAGVLSYFDAPDMEHIYANADSYTSYPSECGIPSEPTSLQTAKPPKAPSQLMTLIARQGKLFRRDKGQLILHGLLLFTFPLLVAVFAYKGIPEVRELSTGLQTNIVQDLAEKLAYMENSFSLASLVSGVSMFQVILLALIGANNGAREIAKERDILTKELRVGLNPLSYLISKFTFIAILSLLQSFWMTFFVRAVCDFPGSFGSQFALLFLMTFAMSSTCLWFSSISKTPERASLLAIYSVGLQLPLSGAVLALPELLTTITRPFIASYWGWSGYLRTFHDFRHYDIVAQSTKTEIATYIACGTVLFLHVAITFILTWWALYKTAKKS